MKLTRLFLRGSLDVFPSSNDNIQRLIVHHVLIEYDTML